MSGEVRTWLAGPSEASEVARLLVEFRDWYGRSDPPEATFVAGVSRLIASPDAEYVLAAPPESSRPAGVCQLRYRYGLWTASDDCWLEDLYVSSDARRFGLGAALVSEAISRARARGCGRIELDVSESNRAAWALYERMGFSADYKPPAPNVLMGLRL